MNNMQVAATVILYNPEDDVYNNISSYGKEVATLIVVDNSTIHNLELIEKIQNSFENLIYINNNANVGIATALNIGCDKAIELGYEWILTMDQDSKFINFSNYLSCFQKINTKTTALIAPNTMWHTDKHVDKTKKCHFQEKFLVITSGNLLNLQLFNKMGRFEDKLFIDMVDHDYCLKVQSQGFKIYFFENILLQHSLGSLFQRKNLITGRIRNKIEHNPQRVYYITRNYLYTWKKYHKQFPKQFNLLKTLNILFIHEITKIVLYEDKKIFKIYAKIIGVLHFLLGRYGVYTLQFKEKN